MSPIVMKRESFEVNFVNFDSAMDTQRLNRVERVAMWKFSHTMLIHFNIKMRMMNMNMQFKMIAVMDRVMGTDLWAP